MMEEYDGNETFEASVGLALDVALKSDIMIEKTRNQCPLPNTQHVVFGGIGGYEVDILCNLTSPVWSVPGRYGH
ncbi:hypothetical protein BTVI_122215 [Pitangus sulphuratus]|nr:hypothetical protein BTVI_122215 [Pitangus sulphuratus]